VLVAALILGVATLATMTLVFVLSHQLRRREMQAIAKIGGSKIQIGALVTVEILSVLGGGVLLAGALSALTGWFATAVMRVFILLS
jgi:hypothetical protein